MLVEFLCKETEEGGGLTGIITDVQPAALDYPCKDEKYMMDLEKIAKWVMTDLANGKKPHIYNFELWFDYMVLMGYDYEYQDLFDEVVYNYIYND